MSPHRADQRLPQSGNVALAAGASIQAALGVEFVLSGLSKLSDRDFAAHFRTFLQVSPGAQHGPLANVIKAVILPHAAIAAQLATVTELGAGTALLLTAIEVFRRRFSGRLGAPHGYEPAVALLAVAAGLTVAGLSMTIYLIQGGTLPGVDPGRALAAPITIELMNVPLALAIAWLELGRFKALLKARRTKSLDARRAIESGAPLQVA